MQRDYEADIRSVYQSILVDGDIAIDVGAHVGEHSIGILEKITPSGHLYAVEPLPAKFREMSERIAHYYPSWRSNLTCYDCALSDRRGRDEFVVAVDAPWFSGLKTRCYDVPTRLERIEVEVRMLDEVFADLPRLRYLKVDAEGGEYHILRGGRGLIERHRPLVTFEFGGNSIGEYGITSQDMWDLWQALDYRLVDIDGAAMVDGDCFNRSVEEQRLWDYIAIPAENEAMAGTVRAVLRGGLIRLKSAA
ncbi:MAG TPA: FkbM family methyltransferase [Candidatus Sumerlaeota bacterium]|nr:FkbM family methyltransferase [Candidatus Sumerlaeota bacterium]HPK02369.1 FkbM family methyltransferase [Candidatus Sumerlaeota bacterium]